MKTLETTHNLAKVQLFKEYLQCDSRQKSVLMAVRSQFYWSLFAVLQLGLPSKEHPN